MDKKNVFKIKGIFEMQCENAKSNFSCPSALHNYSVDYSRINPLSGSRMWGGEEGGMGWMNH